MNIRKPSIFALLYLSGSKIPRNLKEIKKVSKLSNEEAKKYQDKKLKKLVLYSWENVPYYKKILEKSRVVVNGKVNLNNYSRIPILTKEIIKKEGKNLYSKEKRKGVFENTSGGSTGEPVRFLQDKEYDEWNKANKIFYKIVAGQDIGEIELRFWGSERDLLEGKETPKIRFRNWAYNRKEFNTFKMSEKEMLDYVKKWNEYNPSWVESYVQSIYEFAKFIEKNKLKIKSPENGILTSAGTLYLEMKETLERVFRCKVYNRYGSREVGDLACGSDKLKISFWNQKVEIINKKVYVTNLNNYSMPLIRYEIGDMAEFGKNEFELGKVLGRVNNMVKTSKGIVDSAAITSALYFDLKGKLFTSFSKYQLIQKKKDEFELKIVVSDKGKWTKDQRDIENVMKSILGKEISFKFKEVKEIESLKSGKYEYIRSDIK